MCFAYSLGCACLLLRQRGYSKVGLDDLEVWEHLLRLLVLDARVHNHVVARDPIDGSGNSVLVAGLQRVHDAENLSGVAAGGGGV